MKHWLWLLCCMGNVTYAADSIGLNDVTQAVKQLGDKTKLDVLRLESGFFTDTQQVDHSLMLHTAASMKKQFAAWEVALGARLDGVTESGVTSYGYARLDYAENYLRWHGEDTRVTMGTQNIIWGRVDDLSPIDRLSRADLSRVMLDKLPERRRAVPALRLERNFSQRKLDMVWLPIFDAAVLPDLRSAWSPVDVRQGRLLGVGDVPAVVGMPVMDKKHGSGGAGLRFTQTADQLDFGVSVQRVRQSLPYYRFSPNGLLGEHPYSWVLGGELEAQAFGATWRMETAWSSDVPVTTSTFQFATRPALDAVLGVEFSPNDGESRVVLQFAGHKTILDDVAVIDRHRIYALNGEVEHLFGYGRWRAGTRFAYGLNAKDIYINPKISYLGVDKHEFYLAAHLFDGESNTLAGFYKKNDFATLGWQAKF